MNAKVDVVVLDSAHGHSANVLHTVDMIKSKFPDLQAVSYTHLDVYKRQALSGKDRRALPSLRQGCGDPQDEEGTKILWVRRQPELRIYVLAEAIHEEVSEVWKPYGRKGK